MDLDFESGTDAEIEQPHSSQKPTLRMELEAQAGLGVGVWALFRLYSPGRVSAFGFGMGYLRAGVQGVQVEENRDDADQKAKSARPSASHSERNALNPRSPLTHTL